QSAVHRRAQAGGVSGRAVMWRQLLGHLATCVVIAASTLSLSEPARAATLAAVPETVRVNVSLYGTSYALIGSTGAMIATGEDGKVLYKGGQRMVARTNVQRVEGEPITLPPPHEGMTSEERAPPRAPARGAPRCARGAGEREARHGPVRG